MLFIIIYFSLWVFYVVLCRYLVQQYTTHVVLATLWPPQVYVQNWHALTPFTNSCITQLHPLTYILRIPTLGSMVPSPPLYSGTLNRYHPHLHEFSHINLPLGILKLVMFSPLGSRVLVVLHLKVRPSYFFLIIMLTTPLWTPTSCSWLHSMHLHIIINPPYHPTSISHFQFHPTFIYPKQKLSNGGPTLHQCCEWEIALRTST